MKRLSLYLFLIIFTLQTPSLAEDIRDFQIEGMSIGDSLLDYFSEEEIIEQNGTPMGKKFLVIYSPSGSEVYDWVQFTFKLKDKKYLIHSLAGYFNFPGNIKACKKKMKEIENEMKDLFKDSPTITRRTDEKHQADKSGKSKFTSFDILPKSGGWATIGCTDWSDELTKKNNWDDALMVSLYSEEYTNYLRTGEAYK